MRSLPVVLAMTLLSSTSSSKVSKIEEYFLQLQHKSLIQKTRTHLVLVLTYNTHVV